MDYELRIKQAELELRHLRELKALQDTRLDAHDRSIEAIDTILDRIMATVDRTTANLDLLTIQQGETETQINTLGRKIDQLVDALLHGRAQNGGPSGKA